MIGDLIGTRDRTDVTAAQRAAAAAMALADFPARAVRNFVEQADDARWFQLLIYNP